jgi:2-iminoacetate synthase
MDAPTNDRVRELIAKSLNIQPLSLEEATELMAVKDPAMIEEMKKAALAVKLKVYDNRVVSFAPLYLGNKCINNCEYCGFRTGNEGSKRRVLDMSEVKKEVEVLAGVIGHKRLIAVYGEHPETDIEYICASLKAIYEVKVPVRKGYGEIRRVNVNAAPMSIDELRQLKSAGIGTYQVFQETYDRELYAKLHPAQTVKGDYRWRLYAHHRAMEAGIDDVGLGALFGLGDWRYELLGLLSHAQELERRFKVGPHTISFPRMEAAQNSDYATNSPYRVSDEDFLKIILVIRLAVPHTGMIVTARETADIRREAIQMGCTQTDASTQIGIGAYAAGNLKRDAQEEDKQQFILGDTRSLDEVIRDFAKLGYITSFCTAGYRCGRTGGCILDMLKDGSEGKLCKLNAVITFREWLDDFGSPQTQEIGQKVVDAELAEVKARLPLVYDRLMAMYERTKSGERDLYF